MSLRLTHRQRVSSLTNVLRSYADEEGSAAWKEQMRIVDSDLRNIQHNSETSQERQLVGMIYDGLAYGNWPWVRGRKAADF